MYFFTLSDIILWKNRAKLEMRRLFFRQPDDKQ